VRYVIDYYHDESQLPAPSPSPSSSSPSPSSSSSSPSSSPSPSLSPSPLPLAAKVGIMVEVRPALDSLQALFDRAVVMPYRLLTAPSSTSYRPLPFLPPSPMVSAEKRRIATLAAQWEAIQSSCEREKNRLLACQRNNQADCGAASIALQRCTASVVCPSAALEFDRCVAIKPTDLEKTADAFSEMSKCLELFGEESKAILQQKGSERA
jgi:hypothetical protein